MPRTRLAWLTPDDAPGAAICRPVFIPAGLEYEAAFRGAFLLLCESYNWEEQGAQTPDDVAAAFYAAFCQTLDEWGVCPSGGHLIGEIFAYAGSDTPTDCLACDGASISRSTYAALFAVIGTTYGAVDSSHFNVPDLRGRVPIGTGQGSGLTQRDLADAGGYEEHTLLTLNLPNGHYHAHELGIEGVAVAAGGDYTVLRTGNPVQFIQTTSQAAGQHPTTVSPVGHMPPFIALNFFIQAA